MVGESDWDVSEAGIRDQRSGSGGRGRDFVALDRRRPPSSFSWGDALEENPRAQPGMAVPQAEVNVDRVGPSRCSG